MAERKRESISKASLMSDKVVISNGFFFFLFSMHGSTESYCFFMHGCVRQLCVFFFFCTCFLKTVHS